MCIDPGQYIVKPLLLCPAGPPFRTKPQKLFEQTPHKNQGLGICHPSCEAADIVENPQLLPAIKASIVPS